MERRPSRALKGNNTRNFPSFMEPESVHTQTGTEFYPESDETRVHFQIVFHIHFKTIFQ
jgi:hypothetical protein